MRLRLDLAPETAAALVERAVRDLRPVGMEAEVLLRTALSLPVPWSGRSQEMSKETPTGDGGTDRHEG
jgi:hypothetical protein